jgi:hypothetical protein
MQSALSKEYKLTDMDSFEEEELPMKTLPSDAEEAELNYYVEFFGVLRPKLEWAIRRV